MIFSKLAYLPNSRWHRSALLAFAALWFWFGYAFAVDAKSEIYKTWENLSSISNDHIVVRCSPKYGGKITGIYSAPLKGKPLFLNRNLRFNFLSRSERPYVKRALGMPYGDTEFDGIDEIWPSMGEEVVDGSKFLDHGELFSQKWVINKLDQNLLSLKVKGENHPYTFFRDIKVENYDIQFNYTIKNTGQKPINGLYAFHPLFTGMTGATIEVSDDTPAWISWSKKGFLGKRGTKTTWGALPSEGKLLKEDSFTWGRDRYWKVFLKPAKPEVTLRYPNGKGLRLTWKDAHLPYLAVWVSEGMKDLHHIGLEPTNSRFEKHQQMLDNGEALTVPAGEDVSWNITITILP